MVVRERGVDVDVVVGRARQDDHVRVVVQELGAVVPGGRGVLVPLEDEGAGAHRGRGVEILRDRADEVAGVAARAGEAVDDQARHRRLAVGARDDDAVTVPREVREHLREGADAAREALARRAHLRVGLGHELRVLADDDQVRVARQVRGVVGRRAGNAEPRQVVGDGRVEALVRACDGVAALLKEMRDGGHAGPAEADEMSGRHGAVWPPLDPRASRRHQALARRPGGRGSSLPRKVRAPRRQGAG